MQLVISKLGVHFLALSIKDGWRVYDLTGKFVGLAEKESLILVGNNYWRRFNA